jgi:hypothetical protein
MSAGHLLQFPSLEAGIAAEDAFLSKAESNGRDTIEAFRAWYCYDASAADHICPNWEPTVLRIKAELESLAPM